MTKLAYVGELCWRWVEEWSDMPGHSDTQQVKLIKELGYWLDGEWKAIPTEDEK